MVKIILLLSPAFVTLFWVITLFNDTGFKSSPRSFLSTFILLCFFTFVSLFAEIAPYPLLYPYSEVLLAFSISLSLPVYHLYFRLLTIDKRFRLSKHVWFLIIPTVIATIYSVGLLHNSTNDCIGIFHYQTIFATSAKSNFICIMRLILLLHLLFQIVITVIWNNLLINRIGEKVKNYYSEIGESMLSTANILNYSIAILTVSAFSSYLIVAKFGISVENWVIALWTIFSFTFYIIGYLGFKQETLNPLFEIEETESTFVLWEGESFKIKKVLLDKLLLQFEKEKIHLNPKLNIMDVVQAVGSNRTYISALINQHYNQHFCAFVNTFRINEMEKILQKNPSISNENLAQLSGFGSINSCIRAMKLTTGLSISEWKKEKTSIAKRKSNNIK